jgi:translation initiation factor IF-2
MSEEVQEVAVNDKDKSPKKAKSGMRKVPKINIPPTLSVKQLADRLNVNAVEVIKELMRNGIMANINQSIDFSIAEIVAGAFGFKVEPLPVHLQPRTSPAVKGEKLLPRPPVITIMGHVDHGKTSLLDAIRESNIIDTEAGAITQHIGAYQIEKDGRKITFLDTPGHEAFTAMRARGAQATDIAVLVVAADDGVMPQTIEAIHHAQAAGVAIVVALNKIDKANANPDKIKQQLSDLGLLIEEWGGDTICVPVSAKKREGIEDLLENLLLLADILELKANFEGHAEGVAIETKLDKTKGPLATLLVQKGILKVGDVVHIGNTWGKIKAMYNDTGRQIRKAEPATPVEILGLNDVPQAGDIFQVVDDERRARTLLDKEKSMQREALVSTKALSLSDVSDQVSTGEIKELNIILKTDVQGSIEPIKDSLEQLGNEQVKVQVLHASSGSITESDVMLALASKGIIIGFNTRAEPGGQRLAEKEKISIRYYNVIYELINDVDSALKGMLEPTYQEVVGGQAEVRAVFTTGKKGKVAGVMVTEGKISRDDSARIIREGETVFESKVNSLKRFKDDAREVLAGFECGIGIDGFTDFQVGDVIQFYRQEKVS